MTSTTSGHTLADVCAAVSARQRFLLSSHARPDGDSIGSQLALAGALRALGKQVRIVNADPPPAALLAFPGVEDIEVAARAEGAFDAVIVLECSDFARTGVAGLDRFFAINIDHHLGNTGYGAVNWTDQSVASCGQMVFELIDALGAPLDVGMATHVYSTILSDTGGFHHSGISARTFEICRRTVEAGAQPTAIASALFDNTSLGRLKLVATALEAMTLDPSGRLAVMYLDDDILAGAGATSDDTEGLINLPLTVREIQAVVMLKAAKDGEIRVSFRSKGDIDVRAVASRHGGGGHRNAAGCTVTGDLGTVRATMTRQVLDALAESAVP